MISIENKSICCGCGACVQKCPKKSISLIEDSEGFLYPKVDETTCINCGLCEKVCHEQHPFEEHSPMNVYAAYNLNENIRLKSSSGGIFYMLAEKTINEGGVVFGARFDLDWQVVIDYAEKQEDVLAFMGSKYVQARIGNTYQEAEKFLKQGRSVLYSGTPCQIAGLNHYLRKDYDNLTTVDFVCHGVPSPKVWSLYLKEIVKKSCKVRSVSFRNKCKGWKYYNFSVSYNDLDEKVTLLSDHGENEYMKAFLSDIILRPSCYQCKAKQGKSNSDLTIADFWGIDNEIPDMDDDKGTGLILVHSVKGKSILDFSKMKYVETSLEVASKYNPGLQSSILCPPKREYFFSRLDHAKSVIHLINKCFQPSVKQRIRNRLRLYKTVIKNFVKWGKYRIHILALIKRLSPPPPVEILDISFRHKGEGWKNYKIKIKLQ